MSIGEKTTFWELINSADIERIEIPKIQRDYVQGRNTDKVEYARTKMISEILTSVEKDTPLDLNFIYGKVEDGIFIPIDGQQRLTTLFCLHAYAFAKEGYSNKVLAEKFKYSTRTSTSRFLVALLEHLPEFFLQQSMGIVEYIEDAAWYSAEWSKDPSVNSFKIVLQEIHKKGKGICKLTEKLQDNTCPITFMSLKIPDVGRINDLYIKMNSRGKPLTEFESFKSELFDFIDENVNQEDGFDKEDFKKKIDNEWLNIVWTICGENAPEICDTVYIQFLHQIIMNRLLPGKYVDNSSEEWKKLINNNGFYNFANYKTYLKDKCAIRDIYFTFELYRFILSCKQSELCAQFGQLMLDAGNPTHKDLVRIASITQYALLVSKENWTFEGFKRWHRIFNNLINNTQIDKQERYVSACNSLTAIDSKMAANANEYLITTNGADIVYFDSRQIIEEVFKCKLISENPMWEEAIVEVEKDSYFCGEIQFVFSLCEINSPDDISDHMHAIQDFKDVWNLISLLFSNNASANITVNDNLFRRALLVYGDYSCWANSSYTFFFEEGKGYFNWRRLLREEKSFSVFESFCKELARHSPESSEEKEIFLISLIDTYSDKNKDEFLYYTIKIPEVMEYMHGKRFRRIDEYTTRNLLYSGSRLSADYAEANTFFVYHCIVGEKEYHYGKGYLDSDTTQAYIEKIGNQSCHIEFYTDSMSNGYFGNKDRTPYLTASGQPISTVDEMLDYIKKNF